MESPESFKSTYGDLEIHALHAESMDKNDACLDKRRLFMHCIGAHELFSVEVSL